MSLRAIRSRMNGRDFVVGITSLAAAVASVSDMASFPPARAAAMVVLVILQTVQEVQTNKDECYRLARRSAKIMVDLKQRMEGRWESAPAALVESVLEFENVGNIRDFMSELTKVKWMGRILQKGAIENSLRDFHNLLDESERSFQLASLIEIHYTVGILQKQASGQPVKFVDKKTDELHDNDSESPLSPPAYEANVDSQEQRALAYTLEQLKLSDLETESLGASLSQQVVPLGLLGEVEPSENLKGCIAQEISELEGSGFKQYHQSDIRLKTAVRGLTADSFWTGTSNADSGGQKSLVKRYEDNGNIDPARRWLHDVKVLKNLYHPNFPQLVGFSDGNAPTPFILLAHVRLRDPNAFLWNALQKNSLGECTGMMLKMYRDVASAALYAQRQLSLDENETQDFIDGATYSLDGDGNVIVGLPPPMDRNTVTFRSYRLTESLVSTTLKTLPSSERLESLRGTSDSSQLINVQNKFLHLKALTKSLLPREGKMPELPAQFEELLDDMDEGDPSSLSRIREMSIEAGLHDHAWHEGVHACKVSFTCGDIGYIKPDEADDSAGDDAQVGMMDKTRFDKFLKIGNILGFPAEDKGTDQRMPLSLPNAGVQLTVEKESSGLQMQWINGFMQRNEVYPFLLPGELEGWPLMLPPSEEITLYIRHSVRIALVNDAWRYLLQQAKRIAKMANVEPHELIIITRSMKGQTYTLRDHYFHPPIPGQPIQHHSPFGLSPGGSGGFNNNGHMHHYRVFGQSRPFAHHSVFAPPPPKMLYLFTSPASRDFVPFWSENPSAAALPLHARPALTRNVSERTGWPEAYIDYIQLSKEDLTN